MITQKEINQMIDKHELWLSGEKTKGVQLYVEDGIFSELNVADRFLIDVMLAGSTIKKCTLANTDFYYSNLASVIFLEVRMSGVILTKSNLDYSIVKNCDVTSSKLIRATLCEAEVEGVDFSNSDMIKVCFTDATLKNVKFINCDLTWASFRNASLQNVDFTSADLSNADFTNATIKNVDFTRVIYNDKTKWPEGSRRSI
ncbi:pentapeptide repeat-containing protein [Brevibacillus sp. HB1.2]|uniref:pentapeptide repeat-containing protein n=1 Tax=Brevibacillus TaxID=55080 RepID=UPI001576B0ED|nr:pentapeptide repeat-containing protein [Brevibacillus sp. HB1.2]NTU23265.1 pentapeptide repeat-containing protein [Brevibacillus sp. HB1.2]